MKAVEHRLNQIGFVAEVPIDSTPSHPREGSNVGKRGARNTAIIKSFLSSFQNLAPGFLSFLFGATNHGSKTSIKMSQAFVSITRDRTGQPLYCLVPDLQFSPRRAGLSQARVFTNNHERKYIH
jgi:hypothetical protein